MTDTKYVQRIAAEVRAECARRQVTGAQLAELLDVSPMSVSRRMRGKQSFLADEIGEIAAFLEVPVERLLPSARSVTRGLPAGRRAA